MLQNIDHLLGDEIVFQEDVQTERETRVYLTDLPNDCRYARSISVIFQGFISQNPNCDVRIRKCSVVGGDTTYTLTAKYRPSHQEAEMAISVEMWSALWNNVEKPQQKTRYELPTGWIIDDLGNGQYVAEYEMQDAEYAPPIPNNWSVDRAFKR